MTMCIRALASKHNLTMAYSNTHTSSHTTDYRPDIDGLRAIAVMSVIAFHAFPQSIPGGFIGVDIFFVISGFLITSILQKEIANSTFSIQAFYARRIKRLFPALIVVLSFSLLLGWAVLLTHEYRKLGKHTLAGVGFVSNIVLWTESGYFDTNSELKPLLHLWSLGVEEQFYLIWPLLIAISLKLRLNFLISVSILALISFAINIISINTAPVSAFFMPQSRLWELMLGGLLAHSIALVNQKYVTTNKLATGNNLLFKHWSLEIAAILGLVLIGIALIVVNQDKSFPGWWALLPTFGALLLIGAGPNAWICKHLLSWPVLIFIGLISYPLYLWHWPLLSLTRIAIAQPPTISIRLSIVAVAFILAWLTYNYVELPIRYYAKSNKQFKIVVISLSSGMLAIFFAGWLINTGKVNVRLHELSLTLSKAAQDWNYPGDKKAFISGTVNESVLFFGDSYIIQLYPRMQRIAEVVNKRRNVMFHTAVACAPIPGIARISDPKCITYVNNGFKLAASPTIKIVIIGGSWFGMLQRGDYYAVQDEKKTILNFNDPVILQSVLDIFIKELMQLKALGKEVYVVLNPPGGGQADPGIVPRLGMFYNEKPNVKYISIAEHLQRTGVINTQIRMSAQRAGALVIDPMSWICSKTQCAFTDHQGVPYFKDATHFRAAFIQNCVKDFDKFIVASNSVMQQPIVIAIAHAMDAPFCFHQ